MQYKNITIALWIALILSIGLNTFLLLKFREVKLSQDSNDKKCPKGMVCKDFSWVSDYAESIGKEIEWTDCGEGVNKCARWEDYSGKNPLPEILIKQCSQQGTRLENDMWVTGLPIGIHTLVGATIRPCEDIIEPVPMQESTQSEPSSIEFNENVVVP